MKILIIEDNIDLLNDLAAFLTNYGYNCEKAETYSQALEKIEIYNYDLFLIDITLPDGNGLDLISKIKVKENKSGIIIVTAKNAIEDKIKGLDLGADDYLTKPYHKEELNARLRSIIRRNKFEGNNEIEFNEIKINLLTAQAFVNSTEVTLTKKEYDLLLYFIDNKNRLITKESIAEHLWGDHFDQFDSFDFIYNHIKNLRKKIIISGGKDYIQSMYGMGYKFKDEG